MGIFSFANRDSILFDYKRNKVVKKYPRIPGNGSRSYPSAGSSVILQLDHSNGFKKVEVMICGGSNYGAFSAAKDGRFLKCLRSCGRMVITGNKHKWEMEKMPESRLMCDMLLPTGRVLIINGVKQGCAGWDSASNPSREPYLYKPKKTLGRRFSVLKSTKIARMYHSSAILLPDGRVLVAGSNPNNKYALKNVRYPTKLRLEAFVPAHMEEDFDHQRPRCRFTSMEVMKEWDMGQNLVFIFSWKRRMDQEMRSLLQRIRPTSMNQRLLILKCKKMVRDENGGMKSVLEAPPSPKVAPSGYYMLSVVNNGIPGISQWVRFTHT